MMGRVLGKIQDFSNFYLFRFLIQLAMFDDIIQEQNLIKFDV